MLDEKTDSSRCSAKAVKNWSKDMIRSSSWNSTVLKKISWM